MLARAELTPMWSLAGTSGRGPLVGDYEEQMSH
jgi:hypothetical protein